MSLEFMPSEKNLERRIFFVESDIRVLKEMIEICKKQLENKNRPKPVINLFKSFLHKYEVKLRISETLLKELTKN